MADGASIVIWIFIAVLVLLFFAAIAYIVYYSGVVLSLTPPILPICATDLNCPTTQYCNAGTCIIRCNSTGCPTGQTCNPTTGRCGISQSCTNSSNCPASQYCDTSTGLCQNKCSAQNICPSPYVCDPGSGQCIPVFTLPIISNSTVTTFLPNPAVPALYFTWLVGNASNPYVQSCTATILILQPGSYNLQLQYSGYTLPNPAALFYQFVPNWTGDCSTYDSQLISSLTPATTFMLPQGNITVALTSGGLLRFGVMYSEAGTVVPGTLSIAFQPVP